MGPFFTTGWLPGAHKVLPHLIQSLQQLQEAVTLPSDHVSTAQRQTQRVWSRVLRPHSSYSCCDFGKVINWRCLSAASYVNEKEHNLIEYRWRLSKSTHVRWWEWCPAHRKCTIQIDYIIMMIFVLNQGSESDETSLRSNGKQVAEPGVQVRSGRL